MLHDFKPSDDGLDKAQRKAEIDRLREKLAAQQQSVMAAKLPVVVLVEGWDCAGKGHLINELISEMDPRFYRVAVYKRVPENEERYPFLRKFFEPLPENGKFLFMDTGWMEDCVINTCAGRSPRRNTSAAWMRATSLSGSCATTDISL